MSTPGQSSEMELAHVLFMDLVGYSKLRIDQQVSVISELKQAVSATEEFRAAREQKSLISMHTGDGMALAFFASPEAPVRCALQLAQALKTHPIVKLRMGANTGPVYRIPDINGEPNLAGGGINFAQRVMDCGDEGHILLSASVADVLKQHGRWAPLIEELGMAEVKHDERIKVFNLHTAALGNPSVPAKLAARHGQADYLRLKDEEALFVREPVLCDVVDIFVERLRGAGIPDDLGLLIKPPIRSHSLSAPAEQFRRLYSTPVEQFRELLSEQSKLLFDVSVEQHRMRMNALRSNIRQELPSDGSLEIVSLAVTKERELDVGLLNHSNITAYITRLTVLVLKERGITCPMLRPSAKYELPIGYLKIGESASLAVSHVVEPHAADRFLIALQRATILFLRLTLEYNKRYSISENIWTATPLTP